MPVSLRQLEYFIAVAEHGSVTAASTELFVSQSAISSTISELERILKLKLFVRHSRGLSLSREGQELLPRAQYILRDALDFEQSAALLGNQLAGTLNIGCYTTIAPMLIPRMVAQFAESYPGLNVSFAEGSRRQLLDELVLGKHDALVLYNYQFKTDLPLVGKSVRLGSFPPYILLPSSHHLANREKISLTELAEDPLILFGLEPAEEYFLSMFEEAGVQPNIRYRTANHEVLRGLVAHGVGYSLLTQRTRKEFSHEGIEYATAEIADPYEPLEVIAVTPDQRWQSKKVAAFIEIAGKIINDPLAIQDT